jgi:hypothetical protein
VQAVQDGYSISPQHERPEHVVDPDEDTTTEALRLVNAMSAVEFFAYACEALRLNPPHGTDGSMLARIANIGIAPGQPFDSSGLDAATREALEAGVAEARETLADALPKLGRHANGWALMTDTIGVYGNAYLQRAAVALAGLGANPAEDAIYPLLLVDADGDRLAGEQAYVLHFEADELPPVAAFWSITMYDAEGFQVANELDRFAIGDRDPLTFNADGSLDIWLQHDNPGPERTSNWLPAPGGPLGVTMRLYAPDREILDGTWTPPAVRKSDPAH